jgi:hypothetical protein
VFSPTYGVNTKGGMNNDDFGQYILKNFVPLVANDAADIPGKRVILLVDGGPGRTNEAMLEQLRMYGIYLFPAGPPNTTHILQASIRNSSASLLFIQSTTSYSCQRSSNVALLCILHR